MTINGSPKLTESEDSYFCLYFGGFIDLTNYTGTEIFSIFMGLNVNTSQITLPKGWSLYEDEDVTILAGKDDYFEIRLYAIKNNV